MFSVIPRNLRRYAFDVDPESQAFTNRRVFTYVDSGIADGINVDTKGNVYGATADGAHVGLFRHAIRV